MSRVGCGVGCRWGWGGGGRRWRGRQDSHINPPIINTQHHQHTHTTYNSNATNVIGHGVVLHVPGLFDEVAALEAKGVKLDGRLVVSDRAHLLFDLHKEVDGAREAELAGKQIGTTKRGIGPAYASKATRNGLRVSDLRDMAAFADKLRKLAADAKAR